MLKLSVVGVHDLGMQDFDEGALWRLVSFRRNHVSYDDPRGYYRDYAGKVPKSDLARGFNSDTSFLLDHYEHSSAYWSLHGEGMQCRWDTAQRAGLLLANYSARELQSMGYPKGKREESARKYLEVYNDWANGLVFE